MTKSEVIKEIESINSYLSDCLWMDFEVCLMNASQIVVGGRIDISCDEWWLDIIFDQPNFIECLFNWNLDTDKPYRPFIEFLEPQENIAFIDKYHVEQGCYLFKINAENFSDGPIRIAAKEIHCKIYKPPFKRS